MSKSIYIALFRGINVGGNKKIKMAGLKSMLERIGFAKVQTYIQSGNVLFESEDGAESLRKLMEQGIKTAFGMFVSVILRTAAELEQLIADCPYAAGVLPEGHSVQVCLLSEAASPDMLEVSSIGASEKDEFQVRGETIYLLFRQSILDSKLGNNLQKLKIPSTTRNWNTITKLASIAKAMEG